MAVLARRWAPFVAVAGGLTLLGLVTGDQAASDGSAHGVKVIFAVAGLAGAGYLVWAMEPAWAMSCALLLAIFNSHWASLGVPSFGLSPDRLLMLAVLGSIVLKSRRGEMPPIRFGFVHLVMAATLAYAVLSAQVTGTLSDHASQYRLLDRLGFLPFAVFLLAPLVYRTRRDRDILLKTLVGLGVYLSLTALFETLNFNALIWPKYILNPSIGLHFGRGRGPFVDAAANGLVLFACGMASLTAARVWHDRRARIFAGTVAAMCALGVVFTVQRSAWLGSIVGLIVTMLAVRELRRYAVPLLGTALVLVVAALAVVPGLAQHANERRNNQLSVYDRKNLNAAALAMVEDKPLFGVGWSNFQNRSYSYVRLVGDTPITTFSNNLPVHNVFLSNAAELGLVGASVWALALLLAIGGAILLRAPPSARPWQAMLIAYATAWLVVANVSPLVAVLPNLLLWVFAAAVVGSVYAPRAGARSRGSDWSRA